MCGSCNGGYGRGYNRNFARRNLSGENRFNSYGYENRGYSNYGYGANVGRGYGYGNRFNDSEVGFGRVRIGQGFTY
jgi:hypothetical protein